MTSTKTLPADLPVTIEERDIKYGRQDSLYESPIARAMRRSLREMGFRSVQVEVAADDGIVVEADQMAADYYVGPAGRKFLSAYDKDKSSVTPTSIKFRRNGQVYA